MGTPIPGTVIAAEITTGNTDNTFSIGNTNYMQGGHHSVQLIADRDAITSERRLEGMTCWVTSGTGALYRLIGGTNNSNWVQEFAGSSSAIVDEQGTRSEAIQVLQNQIDYEAGTRAQADQTLSNQILAFGTTSGTSILVESGTRSEADQNLQNQITVEQTQINALIAVLGLGAQGTNTVWVSQVRNAVADVKVTVVNGVATQIGESDYALEDFKSYGTGSISTFNMGSSWYQSGTLAAYGSIAAVGTIVQRLYANIPNKSLTVSGDFTRTLKIRNAWQRLRLGVLCAVTSDGTLNLTDCNFVFGLCSSGASYGQSSANFIGASLIGADLGVTRTLTYVASTTAPYYGGTAGQTFRKIDGVSTQISAAAATYFSPVYAGWYKRRAAYYLDITRPIGGSGNATLTLYGPAATCLQNVDLRPDHFMTGLDNQGLSTAPPVVNGQTYVALASTTTAIGEELGQMDTFNLAWSRSDFPLEVSALGAAVIYTNDTYDGGAAGADDPMESYAVSGSDVPISGTLNGGYGWYAAFALNGTGYTNAQTQISGQLVGTTTGVPDDSFSQYVNGSTTVLSAGTGWSGSFLLNGTAYSNDVAQVPVSYVGTYLGFPYDSFDVYSVGSAYTGTTVNAGTGWSINGVFAGTCANTAAQSGYAGTSSGMPYDTFDSYGTGTVISGLTVDGGLGWNGNAYIYS